MRFFLVLLVGLALDLPAYAQDTERLEEIERLREQKARDADALRERTDAARATLSRLQNSLVTLGRELQQSEAAVTASEEKLTDLTAEAERLTTSLASRRRAITDVLAALQLLEHRRPPALLVTPDDANQAAVAAIALASVTPELAAEAARLSGDLDRIKVVRSRAERERRVLRDAEAALSERRRLLEDTLAERERRQAADQTRLRRIEREDAALAREASSLRALIDGIDARDEGRETAQPAQGEPQPASDVAVYADLPNRFGQAQAMLPLPAAGRQVRGFGDRLPGGGRSQDLVLATRPGAIVTAPFGGTIKWAKPYGALGNIVILDVGEGYSVVLIGLGAFDVRRDDVVRAGTPLGTMPPAGGRLRFHLRRGSEVVDPAPWLAPGQLASR